MLTVPSRAGVLSICSRPTGATNQRKMERHYLIQRNLILYTATPTGSSVQDQMLRLPGFLHWRNRPKPKHATDRTQTSDEEW